ncbi:MAG: polyprenyl synthetase family protein [Firmicutes bacterium]|nr:polyprenyl synthetase family protein [Bacillota bacterium]
MDNENKNISLKFDELFNAHWQAVLEILDTKHPQLIQGSRLRPQISLWGFLISKQNPSKEDINKIASAAVSIELIHKATIIIDDWIDNDKERHGLNSYHYDNSPEDAVILSLNMISLSLKRLENCVNSGIIMPQHYIICLNTLIKTIYYMSKGALEEIRLKDAHIFNKDKISKIIQYETSEIIGNSLLFGYYVGLDQEIPYQHIVNEIKFIGDRFGYIFQVFNDLEVFMCPYKLKEHKGDINMDFFLNRKNIVVATLYEVIKPKERELIKNCTSQQLQNLIAKYQITDFLYTQADIQYKNLLDRINKLYNINIPQKWICGFLEFFKYAKKYAESRLGME